MLTLSIWNSLSRNGKCAEQRVDKIFYFERIKAQSRKKRCFSIDALAVLPG
jgi:hypothetical protein